MTITTFEAQLLGWAKSTSKKGPTITFQLLDDEDIAYFEAYTVSKGKTAGQIFDLAVSISDQDDQASEVKHEKPKGGKLSRDAAMLCKSESFWEWIVSRPRSRDWPKNEAGAIDFIYDYCAISSRSELDHNEMCADAFKEIHRNYSQWAG